MKVTAPTTATATACSNIAFIKYWGNRDDALRLPENSSLSMNLAGVYTRTTVTWSEDRHTDSLILNGKEQGGEVLLRMSQHLDELRTRLAGIKGYADVDSVNNFPMGAGIASSASSFAALTAAAIVAAGITLNEHILTTLARLGSGSASRSIPTGFVEWYAGESHETSYAASIANPDHWALVDVIAIVSEAHKTVTSKQGHRSARTSDLQGARVAGAERRLQTCKQALLDRDFATFADVVEYDSNLMHAVMMTSRPPLFYWQPATLTVMEQIRQWRADGLDVCYTLDAGPNVHCLCLESSVEQVQSGLKALPGILDVRTAGVGGGVFIES